MRSIIKDSVVLDAPAEVLYATYLDPKEHAKITGAPVKVSAKPGSVFSAWGGSLSGKTLAVIPSRLIVQSWRSSNFGADDPDSTLILTFTPEGKGKGRIDLVQLDVPEVDYKGVSEGWEAFYWAPWRELVQTKPARAAKK
jgi:activator of HSP90 ATPase